MNKNTTILIVEDEMIIAANISLQLNNLGYEVTGIIPRAEEVLPEIKQHIPDINLMLNQKEPKEKPSIVYKNDLAKKDLGIQFRAVKETLKNYSGYV
jgi:AmiR/NasT family two-component response regulator